MNILIPGSSGLINNTQAEALFSRGCTVQALQKTGCHVFNTDLTTVLQCCISQLPKAE